MWLVITWTGSNVAGDDLDIMWLVMTWTGGNVAVLMWAGAGWNQPDGQSRADCGTGGVQWLWEEHHCTAAAALL